MTETQPGTGSANGKNGDWNRQASTFDWEGWIAEENEADARRAQTSATEPQTPVAPSFPAAQLNYPAPTVPSFTAPPAPAPPVEGGGAYGYRSPDGHPMPQGYAQPGVPFQRQVPTKRPLDVVSVLALVFGVIAVVPVALVLGIVGAVRTANPIRRGRGFAVAGIVLAVAWSAAFTGLAFYLSAHTAQRDAAGAVVKGGVLDPTKLRTGDCFNNGGTPAAGATTTLKSISLVPCGHAHNAEVIATASMPSGAWTSSADMLARANRQCVPLARSYFAGSIVRSSVAIGAMFPTQSDWTKGGRSLKCVAIDTKAPFLGDVKNDR